MKNNFINSTYPGGTHKLENAEKGILKSVLIECRNLIQVLQIINIHILQV